MYIYFIGLRKRSSDGDDLEQALQALNRGGMRAYRTIVKRSLDALEGVGFSNLHKRSLDSLDGKDFSTL